MNLDKIRTNRAIYVRFFLRHKSRKKYSNPNDRRIYCQITVNGTKTIFSTEIGCLTENWEQKTQRTLNDAVANENINLIDREIRYIYIDLVNRKQVVTAKRILNIFRSELGFTTMFSLVTKHYIESKLLGIKESTLRSHRVRKKHLKNFLKSIGREDLGALEFDLPLANKYYIYLRGLGHGNNHAIRCVRWVKAVLNSAVKRGELSENPLLYWSGSVAYENVRKHISEKELKRIACYPFESARLQRVADLFVFQCYTGLAYVELNKFAENPKLYIERSENGREWIFIDRQKVRGAYCRIPLLDKAKDILLLYNYKLPILSNANYNLYLKTVAELCQITSIDNLTTHKARHTLGMLLVNRGVSLDVVSQILGHSSVKTTQKYYAGMSERRINDELQGLGLF